MPLNYAHGYYKAPQPIPTLIPNAGEFSVFGTLDPPSVTNTITVVNNGSSTTDIALTIILADELTIQSSNLSEGSFDGTVWSITGLVAAATATLEIYSTAVTPITTVSQISYDLNVGVDLAITALQTEELTPNPGNTQKLWLSAENACGYTEISDPVEIVFSSTDAIQVSLPANARTDGTGFQFYHLCIGDTPATATRIYRWQSLDENGNQLSLDPVIFYRDEHFYSAPSVALPSDLPTGSDRLSGQTRLVIGGVPTNAYYLYDPLETRATDGINVIEDSTGGKWSITLGTAVLGLVDPLGDAGCAQGITEVDPTVVRRELLTLNTDTPIEQTIWTKCHLVADQLIPAGTPLQIYPYLNSIFQPQLFNQGIKLIFRGNVNLADGSLNIANPDAPGGEMVTIDTEYFYDAFYPTYTTEVDIPVGFAGYFEVTLYISKVQLGGQAAIGSLFSFDLRSIPTPGIPALWGYFTGDIVLADGDRLRVLPDEKIGTGHAVIGQETHPPITQRRAIAPLANDTNDIQIVVDGRANLFIRNPGEALPETEGLRALVSLQEGHDRIAWTEDITVATNEQIRLNRIIPNYNDITDTAIIRLDYPTIGGMTCEFNISFYKLWVLFDGTYYESTVPQTLTQVNTADIIIPDLTEFIATIEPINPPSNFGFFEPPTLVASTENGGGLTAGAYKVGFSYYYTGNQITSISHDIADGCLPELSQTLGELSIGNSFWGKIYLDSTSLSATPTLALPAYHQAKLIEEGEILDIIFDPSSLTPDYAANDRTVGGWLVKESDSLLWALVMS